MSTILFAPETFGRLYKSIHLLDPVGVNSWRWFFGYRHELEIEARNAIAGLVQDLARANQRAYAERYPDDAGDPLEVPDLEALARRVTPYPNLPALYKALKSLRYNLDDADVNGCAKLLDKLIEQTADAIITPMPEYEAAEWAD